MQPTVPKFQFREHSQTCLVISCVGALSWEDREVLANEVDLFLQPRPTFTDVILDLGAVSFVNSAGLGALFQLSRRVRARGGRLGFANVSPTLARVFTAVGLDRLTDLKACTNPGEPSAPSPNPTPAHVDHDAAEMPTPS